MMDERYRDSLQRHNRLLMTHILLTDDIIQLMANEKILPETMIKDIQDGNTKEERNERLLNALRLRGKKSYKRFRELMYRIGNFFVADLLWEEEDGQGMIDEGELAMKFPGLFNCVQEAQKKKLVNYLDAKIREKALLMAWRERPEERIEALSAKVIDFNQERGLRDTIAAQERKIKDLEMELKTEDEKRRNLRLELSSLQQQLTAMKRDHRSQLDTQSRFHDATITTITGLKNKLSSCKTHVAELNGLVKSALDEGGGGDNQDELAGMEDEDDDVRMPVLERNVRQLIQQFYFEKGQAKNGRNQREEVLKLLNRGYTKEPLVTVVKEVLKHEQKHRAMVMRDILRLSDMLKQVVPSSTLAPPAPVAVAPDGLTLTSPIDLSTLDTKHFKSQLAMLKAEVEHIQKRFQWKDSESMNLRHELFALKQRFQDYKIISSVAGQPTSRPNPALAPYTQHICPSCAKSIPQPLNSQTASLPNDQTVNGQNPDASTSLQNHAGGLCQEDLGAEWVYEESGSRRSSMGKSDLDKMMVNFEEYLKNEQDLESPIKESSPKMASTKVETKGGDSNPKSKRSIKNTSALYKAFAKKKASQR